MKKQLLSATAIATAAMLGASGTAIAQNKASKPTISVGGYFTGGAAFVDNADAVGGRDTGGFRAFKDSEIHFNIGGMLDNGIRIGGRWELEGDEADAGAFQDEAYMFLRGGFGEIRIGNEDGAAHLMVLGYQGSWATQVGLNLNFDIDELVPDPGGFNTRRTGVRLDLADNDDPKITYFSPRFGGFQVGASYARDVSQGGPPGLAGGNISDAETAQPVTPLNAENWYSVAANFDRKFGNFRLGVALGYVSQQSPLGGSGKDATEFGGGVLVEFGPVRLSMGAKTVDDYELPLAPGVVLSNDGEIYDLGARYSFGSHQVALAYSWYETKGVSGTLGDVLAPQDAKFKGLWATHSMALGPGVAWKNTIAYADWDGEGTNGAATNLVPGSVVDNDGWGAATHIALSF